MERRGARMEIKTSEKVPNNQIHVGGTLSNRRKLHTSFLTWSVWALPEVA